MQLKSISILLAFAVLLTFTEFATFNVHTAWSEAPSVSLQEKAQVSFKTEEPEGHITLADAVALTLDKNPELAAFYMERRAAEGKVIQSGLLPNPEFSALSENIGGAKELTGGGQTTIQLSQLIELGGKRSARTHVAQLSQDLAEKDYVRKRIEILTGVSKAFIKTLSAQQKLAIAEDIAGLAKQFVKTVSERVLAGKGSPVEETKAKVALSLVMVAQERAKLELASARKSLSSMWGSVSPRFKTAVGDMEKDIAPVPLFEQLTARLTNNPDVIFRFAEISRRKAIIEMEKSMAAPNITVNAGYRRFTGYDENSAVFGVTIPLPIFNRNQGGVVESQLLLSKAEEEQRAAEVNAAAFLAEAFKSLSVAYVEVNALKDIALQGAQSAYDATMEGYRMGKFGHLDVLDAQRTLFDIRLQYIRALTDYHLAFADVAQLIGEPVITKEK